MESTNLPPAPPEEEYRDACCGKCSSLFHATANHPQEPIQIAGRAYRLSDTRSEFPPDYDPAEADRLIGRDPDAPAQR